MPVNITAPYPLFRPRIDRMKLDSYYDDGEVFYRTGRSITLLRDTHTSWTILEHVLAGIPPLVERDGWSATFGTPARLEFFWDNRVSMSYRGAVIFDSKGILIAHVHGALLGYGGSGPGLSHDILRSVGVPDEMFEAMQQSVWGIGNEGGYKVVITREKHDIIEGVDAAYPTLEVNSEWQWHRVD